MLWLKAFHIIFIVCWFAGIFYLPRLFVYHSMSTHSETRAQLLIMEQKLYRFITPFAFIAIGFGIALTAQAPEYYTQQLWFWIKIALVSLLAIYHWLCGRHIRDFANDNNPRSHVYFRWFNEMPVLILFSVVLLAVLKPF